MPVKRSKADIAFSNIVRERSNYFCENCWRSFRNEPGKLHCSHYYGRSARCVRWDADNALSHCIGCHDFLGKHPAEFQVHATQRIGERRLNIVKEKFNAKLKISKLDEVDIAKHYREELKKMQKLRNDGNEDWIDFVNWR